MLPYKRAEQQSEECIYLIQLVFLQYAKLARDLQVPGSGSKKTEAPPSGGGGNGDQQGAPQDDEEEDLSGLL